MIPRRATGVPRSSRRTIVSTVLLGLSGAVGGCVGIDRDRETDIGTEPLQSPTATPTVTTPEGDGETARTPTATVPEGVIRFRSLSEPGQATFRELLSTAAVERRLDEFPETLWDAERIRYRGTTYVLVREYTDERISEYTLTVSSATVENPDPESVVRFGSLDETDRRAFGDAVSGGRVTQSDPFGEKLTGSEYVRYDGEYYSTTVAVADIPIWRLSIRKSTATATETAPATATETEPATATETAPATTTTAE